MANIYLSKLDDFAENLKKSFNKGKSKENLEYQRAASKLYYIRRKNRANWENWNEQQRKEALRLQKDAINYMPVSYTHLDVYKRQPSAIPQMLPIMQQHLQEHLE